MRYKPQHIFVFVVVGVLVLVFAIGTLFGKKPDVAEAKPTQNTTPSVQAKVTPQVMRDVQVLMRGRTEGARTVIVRSETAGAVAATPVVEGSVVRQGQVLCRLAVDARQASLDQARANLRSRQLQRQAAAQLAEKGYRSQTQVLEIQAALDAAQAQVRAAEVALEQVNIRAPFNGVFDRRDAEIGSYLAPGQACGTMIELNPLVVYGDVPETEAYKLRVGAPATARLVSGELMNGKVRYVARDADPQSRTYRVEIAVPNPNLAVRSGLSAEVRVNIGAGAAHLVPVSSIVLDASGRQGIRFVEAGGKVGFTPVTVMEETGEGAWVSGLSGPVRVITVGQSYVAEGQKVQVAVAR